MVAPVGQDLPGNVPGESHREEESQEGPGEPVDVESEHGVGQPRGGTGQQHQLDHSEDVAGVQQPQSLSGAQLEAQLQREGYCEQQQETLPDCSVLPVLSPTTITGLVVVNLQPDCPPGLSDDQQADQPEHQALRQSLVRRQEVSAVWAALPGNTEVYPAIEEIVSSVLHCPPVSWSLSLLCTSYHYLRYVVRTSQCLSSLTSNIKRERGREESPLFTLLDQVTFTTLLWPLTTLPVTQAAT